MFAAVDVGSNTVRMLLGEVCHGKIRPIRYMRHITRLAGGYDARIGLAPENMKATLDALVEISEIVDAHGVDDLRVVGTEALRRAINREDMVGRFHEATGLRLEVISGEEEARLSCAGIFAALDPCPDKCLMFDIGGGSTEFILTEMGTAIYQRSYPLGVVDLCEKHPDPVQQQDFISAVVQRVVEDIKHVPGSDAMQRPDTILVGTAGTVTTLAAMKLRMTDYDGLRVNNLVLTADDIRSSLQQLGPLTVAQREQLPGLEVGRGDLIMPGLRIILAIFEIFGKDYMKVSDFGLLEGILISLADGTVPCQVH